jgi:hypothetical protein
MKLKRRLIDVSTRNFKIYLINPNDVIFFKIWSFDIQKTVIKGKHFFLNQSVTLNNFWIKKHNSNYNNELQVNVINEPCQYVPGHKWLL